MQEILLTLEEIQYAVLNLGHVGDTGHVRIIFDCREFFEDSETRTAVLVIHQPDGTEQSITLNVDVDGFVNWLIDNDVTISAGMGAYQLTVTNDSTVLHSPEGRFEVKRTLTAEEPTPPTPDPDPEPVPDDDNEEEQNNEDQ